MIKLRFWPFIPCLKTRGLFGFSRNGEVLALKLMESEKQRIIGGTCAKGMVIVHPPWQKRSFGIRDLCKLSLLGNCVPKQSLGARGLNGYGNGVQSWATLFLCLLEKPGKLLYTTKLRLQCPTQWAWDEFSSRMRGQYLLPLCAQTGILEKKAASPK